MTAQQVTRVPRLRQDAADAHFAASANAEPNLGVVRRTSLWLDSLVAGNQRNVVTSLELSGCRWVTWSPGCSSRDPGWILVMCGRFTQSYTWTEVHEAMSLIQTAPNLRPRYNIAPTTNIDVVVAGNGERALMSMRWGSFPHGGRSRRKTRRRRSMLAPRPWRRSRCFAPPSNRADASYLHLGSTNGRPRRTASSRTFSAPLTDRFWASPGYGRDGGSLARTKTC